MRYKLFDRLLAFAMLLTVGLSSAWADVTTYKFTSKEWGATVGGVAANWISGKAGSGFSNQGIQVTTKESGANGTSPVSFDGITKIVVTYRTNKSAGAGSIVATVGSNPDKSNEVGYSGSSDGRTTDFLSEYIYDTPQSGSVKLTVNTTTNSLYIVKVAITTSGGDETTATTTTIDASGITNTNVHTSSIAGSLAATVTAGGRAVEGASVTWSGDNDAVATIHETTGAVTLVGAGIVTFTASYAGVENVYRASSATYRMTVTDSGGSTVGGDYVNLPFSYDGGRLALPAGLTSTTLGNDYASAPKLKFDDTGDNLVLAVNEAPGELKFDIKGYSFSGGTFTVQYSADGSSYTDLKSYTAITNSVQTKIVASFPATTRYIRWIYTNKSTGNVGLGNIRLTGCESVTIDATGYATFVPTSDVCFPTGVTAYITTARTDETLILTRKTSVPAGTPVILKGDEGTNALPIITTTPESVAGNLLLASDGTVTGGAGIYALSMQGDVVGFYPVGGGVTIPAGTAYLDLGDVGASGFTFVFDDDGDGINSPLLTSPEEEGLIYNLAGQRVSRPQKGINIVNGRKVFRR